MNRHQRQIMDDMHQRERDLLESAVREAVIGALSEASGLDRPVVVVVNYAAGGGASNFCINQRPGSPAGSNWVEG